MKNVSQNFSFQGDIHPISLQVSILVNEEGIYMTDGRRLVGPYESMMEALDDEETKRRLRFGERLD